MCQRPCFKMSVTGATQDALAVKGLAIEASPGLTIGTFCKHEDQDSELSAHMIM
jgi:hypothetical protein